VRCLLLGADGGQRVAPCRATPWPTPGRLGLLESVRLAHHVSLHWGEASARNLDARRAADDFKLALRGRGQKKKGLAVTAASG
jgi:hypothetical protein